MVTRKERAKIFLPFDALKGFKDALKEKERIIIDKKELSLDAKDDLIKKLDLLKKGTLIKVIFYQNNEYVELTGIVAKIDEINKIIMVVNEKIKVEDIYDLLILDEEII